MPEPGLALRPSTHPSPVPIHTSQEPLQVTVRDSRSYFAHGGEKRPTAPGIAGACSYKKTCSGSHWAGYWTMDDCNASPNVQATFCCDSHLIPVGSVAGWEAAVFDHFQAMVTAL